LDHDHAFAFDDPRFYDLLLTRFQVAVVHGPLAHALDSIHHVAFLRQERIAQVGGPLDIVSQAFHHVGKHGQGLNTGVPRFLPHGIGQRPVLQTRISGDPLLKLDDFERIGGCRQDLGQQRVGIERDRGNQRI
jgi:hypothetical protein